jgi:hypothetical protein
LHASLAADAAPVVEINDSIGTTVQGAGGANFRARGIIAVIASHHPKMARGVGKLALFDMFYPSTKHPNRHLVFLFAGDRTSMTSNTSVLIDDKSVSHLWTFAPIPQAREKISASTS